MIFGSGKSVARNDRSHNRSQTDRGRGRDSTPTQERGRGRSEIAASAAQRDPMDDTYTNNADSNDNDI